jgi:hypothetical protein
MRFDTNKYVASHGKAPRGRGLWCFAQPNEVNDQYSHMFFNGLYSDCKKEAAAYFGKYNDVFSLIVMP